MMFSGSNPAIRIAVLYALFAGLWVLLSDRILAALVTNSRILTQFQTYKGWLFVSASALLIYYLLSKELRSRDRVEESRRRSEASLSALFEQASDGIIVTDEVGKCLDVNQSLSDMLAIPREDLIGSDYRTLIPETVLAAEPLHYEELRNGKKILVDRKLVRRDGDIIPVEISARQLEDGRIQGIVRDISDRLRAEQALKTWAEIFHDIRVGVAVSDAANDRFRMVNQAFADQHGCTIEELVGQPIASVFAPEARPVLPNHIARANREGHYIFESDHLRKDGSLFPALVDVTVVKDEAGKPLYRIASVQDITERKRSEEETLRQLKRLAALRSIDIAITNTLDPNIIYEILLDQVMAQLEVDAAALLLANPHTHKLQYAASRGFRTPEIQETSLSLGKGLAGMAASQQDMLRIIDLSQVEDLIVRNGLFEAEGFISYHGVSLTAKGQTIGVLEIYHRRPFEASADWTSFLESLAGQAAIAIDNANLYDGLQRSGLELAQAYDATLEGWSKALELRDHETQGHSRRVTELTMRLAKAMGFSDGELVDVRRGTLLHDIGKMGVPDSILLKPGPLTVEEWEVMRRHPVYAFQMISPIAFLRGAQDIPYCHHERWDGSGYPRGLQGEQIPLPARIFAVVDVFDALCSHRPYRPAWPMERVHKYIRERAGTHFDPQVVEVFLKMIQEW